MLAHPLDEGPPAALYRDVDRPARGLDSDADAYRCVIGQVVENWPRIDTAVLAPLTCPHRPFTLARCGLSALASAESAARTFGTERARALFGGIAAHGMLPLDRRPSAGFGLVLAAMAHVAGWPLPRGGSQRVSDALAAYLRSLGGEIVTHTRVESLDKLPPARAVLCDLSPRPFLRLAGDRLPLSYRRTLERYRYGMGEFKADFALGRPIPWRDAICAQAETVHVGGTLADMARSERDAWDGRVADRPFGLVTQPAGFDPSRAPAGRHTAWAYCHVPHASSADMLSRIENQIERFAPGFRGGILARSVMTPADLERRNANLVGGDIGAGVTDLGQLFRRPTWRTYAT